MKQIGLLVMERIPEWTVVIKRVIYSFEQPIDSRVMHVFGKRKLDCKV